MAEDVNFALLKEIRNDVKWIRDKTVRHDENLEDILGNGQPGRLTLVENNVEDLMKFKWKVAGGVAILVVFLEAVHVSGEKLLSLIK